MVQPRWNILGFSENFGLIKVRICACWTWLAATSRGDHEWKGSSTEHVIILGVIPIHKYVYIYMYNINGFMLYIILFWIDYLRFPAKQEQHIFLADRVEFMIQYHFTWEAKNRGHWLLNNQNVIKCVCFFLFSRSLPKMATNIFLGLEILLSIAIKDCIKTDHDTRGNHIIPESFCRICQGQFPWSCWFPEDAGREFSKKGEFQDIANKKPYSKTLQYAKIIYSIYTQHDVTILEWIHAIDLKSHQNVETALKSNFQGSQKLHGERHILHTLQGNPQQTLTPSDSKWPNLIPWLEVTGLTFSKGHWSQFFDELAPMPDERAGLQAFCTSQKLYSVEP